MSELPDEPLHFDVTDEEAWAYERLVERLLREAMVGHDGGTTRTILAVEVHGHYPSAQVVASYRDQRTGEEGEGEWELWNFDDAPNMPWEAPSDVASSICASWFRPDTVRVTRSADHRGNDGIDRR